MTKILTYSGVVFDLIEPKAADVRFDDIVAPLSRIGRFNDHLAGRVTLLQHSLLVTDLVGYKARPYALLHDAHEAYIGDITTPVVLALDTANYGTANAVAALKYRIDCAIYGAFGLSFPDVDILDEIKGADLMALAIEKENFADPGPDELWADLPEPVYAAIPFSDNPSRFRHMLTSLCPKVPA
jgi:hypothetical protein